MYLNGTALWVKIGLLLLLVDHAISCYGYSTTTTSRPEDTTTGEHVTADGINGATTMATNKNVKNKVSKQNRTINAINEILGGWPPTENLTKNWADWLNDYKNKTDSEKAAAEAQRGNMTQEEKEKMKKERGSWPSNWQDLGPGYSGEVPPPWAYAPQHIGLPDFCYQWPQRGNCHEIILRWGYNSHANQCDPFPYSGCGENQNNFKDKLSCEQACMIPPVSGCDTDSHIPVGEDYDNVLEL